MRRLLDRDEELKAASGQKVQRAQDAVTFERRNDIYTQNANMFISNNANPFLISPYGPPANLISKQLIAQLSSIVSTLAYSLSTIIDINTFTIRISTIRPVSGQSTITLNTNTLNITAAPSFLGPPVPSMNVAISSFFNTINTNYLTVNSTLTVSTITGTVNFDTLQGSNIVTSTLTVESTLNVSSITFRNASGRNLTTSTLITSTIVASTLVTSTINTSSMVASTIQAANYLSTTELVYSSLFVVPFPGTADGGSIPAGASAGSIFVNLQGIGVRRIPYFV
jgi:hypothetical protein